MEIDNGYFYSEEWIEGYKAFYGGLTNQYGEKYEIGKVYVEPKDSKHVGYHFCKNIEDTLVFYPYSDDIEFYQVSGKGNSVIYSNDYYGVYNVYATEMIRINRKVEREEIINYFLNKSYLLFPDRICRFISLYRLNSEEIEIFKSFYKNNKRICRYISYYQEGKSEAFKKKSLEM